ncbi:MAG: hypothetical protein ACK5QH_19265 [Rubrivivax sp.]
MNVALDAPNAVPYFTDMKTTLDAAEIKTTDFDWYVSDLETNYSIDALPASAGWMTGQELEQALAAPGLQFIWAIFSAFPKGTRFEVLGEPCDGQFSVGVNMRCGGERTLFVVG